MRFPMLVAILALSASACGSGESSGPAEVSSGNDVEDVALDAAGNDGGPGDAAGDSGSDSDSGGSTSDSTEISSLPFPEALEPALEEAIDSARAAAGAPGAAVAIVSADNVWATAAGTRSPEDTAALTPAARLRVGTVAMPWTAALVLSLVEAELLQLDDTVDAWVPELPNAASITVKHLLSHTSGLPDFLDNPALASVLDQPHSPAELIAFAAALAPKAAPGAAAELSHTNFVALGLIAEAIAGVPYQQALKQYVSAPLGLVQTYVEGTEIVPGGVVPGFTEVQGALVDVTSLMHPANGWSAAGIASTAADVARLGHALWAGDLLPTPLRGEVIAPVSLSGGKMSSFGLGCIVEGTPGHRVVRHPGIVAGYRAELVWDEATNLAIAVLTNAEPNEPAKAIIDALLALLRGEGAGN